MSRVKAKIKIEIRFKPDDRMKSKEAIVQHLFGGYLFCLDDETHRNHRNLHRRRRRRDHCNWDRVAKVSSLVVDNRSCNYRNGLHCRCFKY